MTDPAAPGSDTRSTSPSPQGSPGHGTRGHDRGGIGFALFLLLAGLLLLAERLGWAPIDVDWLFPAILIAWGAGELYQRLGTR
jgi:hypothetical protein